jgi:hypothetical protein
VQHERVIVGTSGYIIQMKGETDMEAQLSIILMDLSEAKTEIEQLKQLVRDYEDLTYRLHHWRPWYYQRRNLHERAKELGVIDHDREEHVVR